MKKIFNGVESSNTPKMIKIEHKSPKSEDSEELIGNMFIGTKKGRNTLHRRKKQRDEAALNKIRQMKAANSLK